MKRMIFLLYVAAFCSCKKDNIAQKQGEESPFKKNLTELTLDNGTKRNFTYNAGGRVITDIGNYTQTTYLQTAAFSLSHKYISSGALYELKNTTRNASGKITSADRYYNGSLQSKLQYSYNSEGRLVKQVWQRLDIDSKIELNYYYENGNLVKVTDYTNGNPNKTYMFEYDLSTPNPFKLDWQETMQTGFISDDQFGRLSQHLIKKEIRFDKDGNKKQEILFSFTMDAEGYPISMIETGGNYATGYTFKFQ